MAFAKATAETEAVLKEDPAQERDTDGGSGETKEVDLTVDARPSFSQDSGPSGYFQSCPNGCRV